MSYLELEGTDPREVCDLELDPTRLPGFLAEYRQMLCPEWLKKGARGEGHWGRPAWPQASLLAIELLRWDDEGMPRATAVERTHTDMAWRAAAGIPLEQTPPSEKRLRTFEQFLMERHPDVGVRRIILWHGYIVRLCQHFGVGASDEAMWMADSTPMWCYGALKDTIRMMGDGLRRLGRWWAKVTEQSVAEVAEQWDCPLLEATSTKGHVEDIEWSDADARGEVTDSLAEAILEHTARVRRHLDEIDSTYTQKKGKLLELCRHLCKIITDDLSRNEEGRLVVAERVAADRLVSLSDPQARSGRKSQSRTWKGFKLHLLGDLESGLIASLTVTPADVHDGEVADRLMGRAHELIASIEEVLGDHAYGATKVSYQARKTLGIEVIAPVSGGASPSGESFGKNDFDWESSSQTAICPANREADDVGEVQSSYEWANHTLRAMWNAEVCENCPMQARCPTIDSGRTRVVFHPLEGELRRRREAWETEAIQSSYRERTRGERLVNRMVRHGARQVRAWGLRSAECQAYLIAIRNNLALLAEAMARRDTDVHALEEAQPDPDVVREAVVP